jgi:hypothetical protein
MAEDAGNLLVAATKASQPRIPIIVASKAERAGALRDVALVIPKGDPETVQVLDQYVHDFTGLGDFLFYRGRELWRRVSTLTELRRAVVEAPVEMLEEYADKDYYSTWLYMHGFRELADRLRGVTARGEELRRLLASSFSEEEMLVDEQELLVTSEAGHVLGRARTVQELAGVIQELDAETLVAYADRDVFSMWVMRKGYPRLAARLRPIFGDGEELRQELVRTLARWQADEGG